MYWITKWGHYIPKKGVIVVHISNKEQGYLYWITEGKENKDKRLHVNLTRGHNMGGPN